MMPGLTVPVVRPAFFGSSSDVCMTNSTIGIIRLSGAGRPTSRTKDWRYCRLYCTVKPHFATLALTSRSTSTLPSSSRLKCFVACRVGIETPNVPVTATGFTKSSASGKSPKPLPKKSVGVTVSKRSASIFRLPVPPTSHEIPADRSVSCASLLKNTYFSETSRLSKPDNDLPSSGSSSRQAPPRLNPKFGLSRFENSPLTSVSRVGGRSPSPRLWMWKIVGSDSSSATNGSSIPSVAGKNRLPASPWAPAEPTEAASAAARDNTSTTCFDCMGVLPGARVVLSCANDQAAEDGGARPRSGREERTSARIGATSGYASRASVGATATMTPSVRTAGACVLPDASTQVAAAPGSLRWCTEWTAASTPTTAESSASASARRRREPKTASATTAATSAGTVADAGTAARRSTAGRTIGVATGAVAISDPAAPVCAPVAPADSRSAAAATNEARSGRTMADTVPPEPAGCLSGSAAIRIARPERNSRQRFPRRRRNELAVPHATDRQEVVRQPLDRVSGAAERNDLEAGVAVEVDVQSRRDHLVTVVLDIGELVRECAGVVVIHQHEDADRLPRLLVPLLLHQLRPAQIADELATVGVAARWAQPVERAHEGSRERHGEP